MLIRKLLHIDARAGGEPSASGLIFGHLGLVFIVMRLICGICLAMLALLDLPLIRSMNGIGGIS